MATPQQRDHIDKKIANTDRLGKVFTAAMAAGALTFSGGLAYTTLSYTFDHMASDAHANGHHSMGPSPAAQAHMEAGTLIALGGILGGGLMAAGASTAISRQRRLEQQKFRMEFRMVQDMMQPAAKTRATPSR